jgi:hypothetical protein
MAAPEQGGWLEEEWDQTAETSPLALLLTPRLSEFPDEPALDGDEAQTRLLTATGGLDDAAPTLGGEGSAAQTAAPGAGRGAGHGTRKASGVDSTAGGVDTPSWRDHPAVKLGRLVALGALLAGAFVAGAFFFLPTPAPAPAPSGPGQVQLTDFELAEGAPLSRTAVGEALAGKLPAFNRCLTQGELPDVDKLTVRVAIASTGSVKQAAVVGSSAKATWASCIVEEVRQIEFPAFEGKAVDLAFPLTIARP